jgi:rhodanese-related sulfurtransferase
MAYRGGATARVNSGPNVLHTHIVTPRELAAQRGEVFKRISTKDLNRLVVSSSLPEDPLEYIGGGGASSSSSSSSSSGALRFVVHTAEPAREAAPAPRTRLVVDVREPEEYARSHLVDSVNMPRTLYLTKDRMPPEVYALRRTGPLAAKSGPEILVAFVCGDGKAAAEVATKLVLTDALPEGSVYVLAAGLKAMAQAHPLAFEGADVPASASASASTPSAAPASPVGKGTRAGRPPAGSTASASPSTVAASLGSPLSSGAGARGSAFADATGTRGGSPTLAAGGGATIKGAVCVTALAPARPHSTFGTSSRFAPKGMLIPGAGGGKKRA